MQLTYQVTHSVFGDIGTYTNLIEPTATGTTVQTRAHFQVKMLGVNMYHEDAQRTERWQGNRLISFSGVTSKGSGSTGRKGRGARQHLCHQFAAGHDHGAGIGSPGQPVVSELSELKHDDAAR